MCLLLLVQPIKYACVLGSTATRVNMEYVSERTLSAFLSVALVAALTQVVMDVFYDNSSDEDADPFEHAPDGRFGPKPYQPRTQYERKDYSCSQAAQMLIRGTHLQPGTKDHRDFRSFYRIPPQFFERFHDWFLPFYPRQPHDCSGRPAVPFKLKLLHCFFMLAHGVSALAVSATIGCDAETMRVFFLDFIRTVEKHLAPLHVRLPATEEELAAAVSTYAEESLPGCFGSIDCTHIGWTRARAAVHSWFVGKEGVPTVAFQVIVDHDTKVMSVSDVFPGSHSDETISRLDPAISAIRCLPLFTAFAFVLLSAPGVYVNMAGAYLLSDGGYQVSIACKSVSFVHSHSILGLANFSDAAKVCDPSAAEAPVCANCFHTERCGVHFWQDQE